jgi:ribosomal protein S27AE
VSGERDALAKIFEHARAQLHALRDGSMRSDVDSGGLARVCFEMLLEGIAAEASKIAVPPSAELVREQREFAKETVQAAHHLAELAEGWRCGKCGNTQPKAAVLSAGPQNPQLELVCKRCGEITPGTGPGKNALRATFGHLFGPEWDFRRNGFS